MKVLEVIKIKLKDDRGEIITNSDICLVSPNGTYIDARKSENGEFLLEIPDKRAAELLIGAPGFSAYFISDWAPEEIEISLKKQENGGGKIIHSTGQINGLLGKLNPIKDSISRMYIYGDNISFDDIDSQPYLFKLDIPFSAEDRMRNRYILRILKMIGQTALIDYERVDGT